MIFLEARDIKKGKYTKALIQKMRSELKCYGMFVVLCYLANPQNNTRNIFHIYSTLSWLTIDCLGTMYFFVQTLYKNKLWI